MRYIKMINYETCVIRHDNNYYYTCTTCKYNNNVLVLCTKKKLLTKCCKIVNNSFGTSLKWRLRWPPKLPYPHTGPVSRIYDFRIFLILFKLNNSCIRFSSVSSPSTHTIRDPLSVSFLSEPHLTCTPSLYTPHATRWFHSVFFVLLATALL